MNLKETIRTTITKYYEGRDKSISADYAKASISTSFEVFCTELLAESFTVSELAILLRKYSEDSIITAAHAVVSDLLKEETK